MDYHDEQLQDILAARVKWGLDPDVISETQLYQIADAAAGDARLAIGILRSAASMATDQQRTYITDALIEDAAADARTELKQKNLDMLTPYQRAVYDIAYEQGPIGPSEIYDRYTEVVSEPRTDCTVRTYLSKMAQYNLVSAEGQTQDRKYRVIGSIEPLGKCSELRAE